MNLPILSHIYTQEERVYLLDRLEKLEQTVFSVKSPFEQAVHELFSLPLAESLLETITSAQVSLSDTTATQQFLQELQGEVKKLPEVSLRLAFTPSYDLLRYISNWFDSAYGMKVIVAYEVDQNLIGGVSIALSGKYVDYSLKKLIQEKISTIREDKMSDIDKN